MPHTKAQFAVYLATIPDNVIRDQAVVVLYLREGNVFRHGRGGQSQLWRVFERDAAAA